MIRHTVVSTGKGRRYKKERHVMRRAVFYGWYIVGVCFLIALFSYGLGFYGPGIYLIELQASHG
jgi:hypothetical protein